MSAHHRSPPADAPAGFEELFEAYYWPVLRLFQRRGFDPAECQDLAQETFLQVYEGLDGYRGEAPIAHWVFRIAANTATKRLRYRLADKRSGDEVDLERAEGAGPAEDRGRPDPLSETLARERREAVHRAVDELPPQMRRCVRLRLSRDLPYGDIAALLQISEATVKVQLFKARKRLKTLLDPQALGLGVEPEAAGPTDPPSGARREA